LQGLADVYRLLEDNENAVKTAEELVNLYGDADEPDELKKLEENLSLYDKIMEEYEKGMDESWKENLRKLVHPDTEQEKEPEHHENYNSEIITDLEGEMVPIIDVGGIEPVIAVNEKEDTLTLSDEEEELIIPDKKEEEEPAPEYPWKDSSGEDSTGQDSEESPSKPDQQPTPQEAGQGQPQDRPQSQPQDQQPTPQEAGQGQPQDRPPSPPPNYPPYPPYPQYPPYPSYPPPFENTEEKEEGPEEEAPAEGEATEEAPAEEEAARESEPENPAEPEEGPEEEPTDESEEKIEAESAGGLLEYLEGLTDYLPERERREYSESDIKLRMKALQGKLQGHNGLRNLIEKQSLKASPEKGEASEEAGGKGEAGKTDRAEGAEEAPPRVKSPPLNQVSLENTFSYLKTLSSYLPDQETGLALGSKMRDILSRLHKDR
ncbi:MAG: hypothetical protein R6V67_05360, partial [Spirochaetia bacterium]